jgi:dTDP-4-dehydrorhamnose 3,5-epimerase
LRFIESDIPGCFTIEPTVFTDERGNFIKTFNKETFEAQGLEYNFQENYHSLSNKDVVRGMHFQLPPFDHAKVVSVYRGRILDFILDLREGSPYFKKYITVDLSEDNHRQVYIPRGCAHGFISLRHDTCVSYLQTSVYSPKHDTGLLFSSLNYDSGIENPIMSVRDLSFESLDQYQSPFSFKGQE